MGGRPTRTRKETYDKFFCYIPTNVAKDSGFPFEEGEDVLVVVDPARKEVILRKLPSREDVEKT